MSPGEIAVGSVEEDSEEADGMPALESLSTAESVGADDSGEADDISALEGLSGLPPSFAEAIAIVVGSLGVVGWLSGASLLLVGIGTTVQGLLQVFGWVFDMVEVSEATSVAMGQCSKEDPISVQYDLDCIGGCLAALWTLAALYRLGWILVGLRSYPLRFEGFLPDFMTPVSVPCCRGWWLWLFLVVLFSLVHSSGAQFSEGTGQVQVHHEAKACPTYVGRGHGDFGSESYGGIFWVLQAVALIFSWETFKRVMCQRRLHFTNAPSQTATMAQVPLPLEPGVPNLYCLWRAGYQVSLEPYPQSVQDDYHRYVGSYWRRQAVDEDSSD